MKRRDFLKWLGIGTIASIVAPKVIAEAVKESSKASKNLPYYNALDCVMSGTQINMEPFVPNPYTHYCQSFTYTFPEKGEYPLEISYEYWPKITTYTRSENYNDMMDKLVMTIDKELKRV